MDNFNNNGFPPHNNGNNFEEAEQKNRIQQLKLELIKTDDPIKKQQIQELLDAELKSQENSQVFRIIVFIIFGLIFLGFLFSASQMGGGF